MTEAQILNLENLNEGKPITFTPLELKYFVLELKDMFKAGEFDIPKVLNAARFYAEMERRTENIKAGHWVEHDLIEVDDDE